MQQGSVLALVEGIDPQQFLLDDVAHHGQVALLRSHVQTIVPRCWVLVALDGARHLLAGAWVETTVVVHVGVRQLLPLELLERLGQADGEVDAVVVLLVELPQVLPELLHLNQY